METFRSAIESLSRHTQDLARRSADLNLRLAVTGLSGAGKTAFITGLVHQLTHGSSAEKLPLWEVCRQQRLLGTRKEMQPNLDIASFDLTGALASLSANPPQWPASTRTISEMRLAIRFRPKQGLRARVTETATLYLDIVDYPGEWLLDLPMLRLTFREWCQQQKQRLQVFQQSKLWPQFQESLHALNLEEAANEQQLKDVAASYQQLLKDLVLEQGFYQAQPGRMLLPGELEGTPLLTFFPLLTDKDLESLEDSHKDSTYQVLKRRYQEYVNKVVKPFYKDHFAHFDRQVVLVDCLTALNRGRAQFEDMTQALNNILESFQFGKSNFLRRLFAPRIDKLLIAASKVDHVTTDQQPNLLNLLTDVLRHSRHYAGFDGCEVETMAISAIRATRAGVLEKDGERYPVIQGYSLADNQQLTVYPGQVPRQLPDNNFWEEQGFEFTSYRPRDLPEQGMDHIRLDHLLEYLLGDKLV
ncbi:YcjX family protein [Parendozoicomonas haliclonae]|uniref:YcjX family protein n=1 Tax=Parendozoicomonas haliclonae TaxID=1960125 RepID=A0A1X7ANT8_9GAMM|nr:YcjX family protein [Parendozoicomonas haliclonae]SMA49792.1 hypothetical protein EHSB41UT_03581 [Parendozoicomonas haliclonae]